MANEILIDKVVDREAVTGDVEFVDKAVQDIVDLIRQTRDQTANIGNAKNLSQYNKATKDLVKSHDELAQKTKIIVNSHREVDKALIEGKISRQEYNKTLKQEIQLEQAAAGSRNAAKAAIAVLAKERDNLNAETAEGKKRLEEINKELDKHNKFLDDTGDKAEKQRRNIGNYVGSAKLIVDALEAARKKVETVNDAFGAMSPEATQARKEFEALDGITKNPRFLNVAANVGDSKKEVAFFTKELDNLKRAGLENTDVYREIIRRLAELDDSMGDTRAAIKALASDTREFDLFAGAVTFAADVMQTAAGAAVLLGASEEDAAAATRTLVAIQSVANGVKGIATELTTKGTAANLVYAKAQLLVATATNRSTAATVRLAAAGKLLLGVGLIALIGFLVVKYAILSNNISDAAKRQKRLNDVMSEGKDEYVKATTEVENLKNEIKLAKEGIVSKTDVVKHYNETIGKTTGEVKNLDEAEKALAKNAQAYIQFTLLKAAANVALAKAAEEAFKIQFNAQTKTQADVGQAKGRQIRTEAAITAKVAADEARKAGKSQAEIDAAYKESYENAITAGLSPDETKSKKDFETIASDLFKQASDIAKKFKFDFFQDGPDKGKDDAAKKAKDRLDKELQAQFNIIQLELQRRIDFNKEIADDETRTLDVRLKALQEYLTYRQVLINAQANLEKQLGYKTATEVEAIEAQQADSLIRLRRDVSQQGSDIIKQETSGVKDNAKAREALNEKINNDAEALIQRFQDRADREAKIAADLLEKKKGLKEAEKELYKELYNELGELALEFFTSQYDREIAANEEEKTRIDESTQKDIERINQEVTNRQEAADQIRIIEAKAAADKQVLDNKNKESERRKAQIAKIGKAAEIISGTATSIADLSFKAASARAQAALLAANPVTAAYAPVALANAGIITAQIPLVAAIGAAQIAKLVLPKYKFGAGVNGRPRHRGGYGEVGHGRMEVVHEPGRSPFVTPATPTIMPIAKDAIVYPSIDDYARHIHNAAIPQFSTPTMTMDNSDVIAAINQQGSRMVKAVKNMPRPIFRGQGKWDMHMSKGHSTREWLNKTL